MRIIYSSRRRISASAPFVPCLGLAATLIAGSAAQAQQLTGSPTSSLGMGPALASVAGPGDTESSSLPDAPSTTTAGRSGALADVSRVSSSTADRFMDDPPTASAQKTYRTEPFKANVVPAGYTAPRQTVRDKLVFSVGQSVSPYSLSGELLAGAYAHLTNGSPNYGTNSTAFAQRFGAAVARGTSQHLFEQGALSILLHEDPRYYQLGSSQPAVKRLSYAITRPLITRTDSGRTTPNLALLGGYLGAAALTKVYYPPPNQGFTETLRTYGGSLGGAALGFATAEFLPDALLFLHLRKPQ